MADHCQPPMSVYTTVTPDQLRVWLQNYSLGELTDLTGIAAGITNTNYFVTTSGGRYVLTLFEKNDSGKLPHCLDLMAHLADHGIPCPHPVADAYGNHLGQLNGKPATLVTRLRGTSVENPEPRHCAAVGAFLAHMHLAGQSFPVAMENTRGPNWRNATAQAVLPQLATDHRILLEKELAYQSQLHHPELPRGVIHADLFRDNVLFDGNHLGGAIDFYYACTDTLVYDLAIAINDWCVNADATLDFPRLHAMLNAYHAVRPLSEHEHAAWPALLRAGALRFWLSRLYDAHFPQPGEMTFSKNPEHFRQILEARIRDEAAIRTAWVN